MKLKILVDGDPILRVPAADVLAAEFSSPEISKLIADMADTMKGIGVGIAAPQVGVSKRILLAESPQGIVALANPVITKFSKKTQLDDEGCLSVPKLTGTVERAQAITVRAQTMDGNPITFDATGYFARIIQHETDHLNGILFIDRLKEQGRSPHR